MERYLVYVRKPGMHEPLAIREAYGETAEEAALAALAALGPAPAALGPATVTGMTGPRYAWKTADGLSVSASRF